MMIESIKRVKRGFKVCADGEEYLIHRDVYATSDIVIDQEVELSEYVKRSNELFCYEDATRYLAYRARTKYEVKVYLTKKEYEPSIIEAIVSILERDGVLNDKNYARDYSDQKKKTHGRYYISQKLQQKGIDKSVLDQLYVDESVEDMLELIQRKYSDCILDYQQKGKIYRFLAGRGFSSEKIYKAIEMFQTRQDIE